MTAEAMRGDDMVEVLISVTSSKNRLLRSATVPIHRVPDALDELHQWVKDDLERDVQ